MLRRSRYRIGVLLTSFTLSVAVLAGCGAGSSGDVAQGETAQVTLGVIPIVDIAPVRLGIDKGIFAKHGLEITTQNAQGGAAIVPAVVAGDFQFGYSNMVSLLSATSRNLPLELVSVGARASDDVMRDGSAQLLTRAPTIKTPADLAGKRIAINVLRGVSEVAVRAGLRANGVDPASVELVEVPIPNMGAALEGGEVDAVLSGEPFISQTVAAGARPLPISYPSMGERIPFAGWFTTRQYAEEHPEVTRRFTAALEEALRYAQDHPDEARAAIESYLQIPGGAGDITLPGWDPTVDRAEIARIADLSVEFGIIPDPSALDKLLAK